MKQFPFSLSLIAVLIVTEPSVACFGCGGFDYGGCCGGYGGGLGYGGGFGGGYGGYGGYGGGMGYGGGIGYGMGGYGMGGICCGGGYGGGFIGKRDTDSKTKLIPRYESVVIEVDHKSS